MKKGDILQSPQGHIIEIFDVGYPSKTSISYIGLEDDEVRYASKSNFSDYENIGEEKGIKAMFHLVKSIHLRLNKLNKI